MRKKNTKLGINGPGLKCKSTFRCLQPLLFDTIADLSFRLTLR